MVLLTSFLCFFLFLVSCFSFLVSLLSSRLVSSIVYCLLSIVCVFFGRCGKQEKSGDRLKKCACHRVFYCNKACLRQHWHSGHREECEEMRMVFEATQAAKNNKGTCLSIHCDRTTKEGGGTLMKCPCKSVHFCSKEHQKLAWPEHKALCKQLRKEMKKKGTGNKQSKKM